MALKQPIQTIKMRRVFADEIYKHMKSNNKIWILTGDLGYKMWDRIRLDFPDRFINTGAAEQTLMGMGVGLALKGKIPFVYSITTFLLYRAFETIRNYVNHENIPVKLIGAGRDKDYIHDGFSHWAQEDKVIMKQFSNIRSRWPNNNEEISLLVKEMIDKSFPYYINLRK